LRPALSGWEANVATRSPPIKAALRTVADRGSLGIVPGGSGNGEQIAANKVPGARCAPAWNPETASLAREHTTAHRRCRAHLHKHRRDYGLWREIRGFATQTVVSAQEISFGSAQLS
jgi:hypothetical protein